MCGHLRGEEPGSWAAGARGLCTGEVPQQQLEKEGTSWRQEQHL